MTGAEALRAGVARLKAAGIEDPARDARRLLAFAIGQDMSRLTLVLPDPITEDQNDVFRTAILARAEKQPVSQIIGYRDFFGRRFKVTRDTLDPRPETEDLVAEALKHPFSNVLDMGTGTGCILLSLLAERPLVKGLGTDLSDAALSVARENADRLNIADRASFARSDWYANVAGRFDLIVSNPPYIAADEMDALDASVRDWEPRSALTDEADGLSAYRVIAAGAKDHLTPGGRLLVEIGWMQGEAVAAIFRAAGLESVSVHPDLDGRDRVVTGRQQS
ncbi:peptide chain release factor N(5)-glutamine methyltransferase [Actibacterium pelagium]|uniref:Release factor glutamine methyltransferase n=1 Tax=Actibacterium pelagium TaxID=2029103 RepID=A0A917AFH9_9RHOB|nr:peptide chain release factor N(5)-glutamine methyltransferase [Actibacterium pelagium]GGE44783.1 release factor glutamine methyltransferase [Actibacterium pelagium]